MGVISILLFLASIVLFILFIVFLCTRVKALWVGLSSLFCFIFGFLLLVVSFSASSGNESSGASSLSSETSQVQSEDVGNEESLVSKEDILTQKTDTSYKDLLRNPDDHVGEYVIVTVQISQVLEAGLFDDETFYFGHTDNADTGFFFDDEYSFVDSRIDDDTKLLEGDVLKIYGKFTGLETFSRALTTAEDELPCVEMLYVEILDNDEEIFASSSFDETEVLSQLNVTEYKYSDSFWNYFFLVVENNSEFNLDLSASVKFYDESGNLTGANDSSQEAFESGTKTILCFMPDDSFDSFEYELSVSEETTFNCVVSDLSFETTTATEKEILSVTNNGEKAAEFVEAYALFFMGEEVVGFTSDYFVDDDSELKPGETITREMDCYQPYDSVQFYFTGRR